MKLMNRLCNPMLRFNGSHEAAPLMGMLALKLILGGLVIVLSKLLLVKGTSFKMGLERTKCST